MNNPQHQQNNRQQQLSHIHSVTSNEDDQSKPTENRHTEVYVTAHHCAVRLHPAERHKCN